MRHGGVGRPEVEGGADGGAPVSAGEREGRRGRGCDAPKISNLNYALKCPDRKFIRRKTLTLSVSPSH
jgi:hypothetical protein